MGDNAVLMTDSSSDLPVELVRDLGIETVSLAYMLQDRQFPDDFGQTQTHAEFYAAMRSGLQPTTSQVPRQAFVEAFRRHAEAGDPVLYLAFSSALSGTFDAAWSARKEVLEEYPEARIMVLDTRAAAVAQGLLVYEAALRWRDGMPLEELGAWVMHERPRLNGWFVVDDLDTLRRGGRLNAAAATAGTLLDVKPLLHVSDEGRLELKRSIRGRNKAMRSLADLLAERASEPAVQTVAVGHADCAEDAARLCDLVRERVDVPEIITMQVGPVIGAHTGPGMLAVAFWGEA